jgi:hypothetical protein
MSEPFHSGEIQIQELTGERDKAVLNGHLIADSIPPAARSFVGQQSYCALGWADSYGDVWAELLLAEPGFAQASADGLGLDLRLPTTDDAPTGGTIFDSISRSDQVGIVFVEFATRRRLRVNGVVASAKPREIHVRVAEAYPNCPKYIQRRDLVQEATSRGGTMCAPRSGRELNTELAELIAGADTFFVASVHPDGPADCSHRGGTPGFVEVNGNTLYVPDYPGNSMFGTLGNLAVKPRAGLAFIDFDNQRQLQMTGDVTLNFTDTKSPEKTGGTDRWWSFHCKQWRLSPLSPHRSWRLVDRSPFNP